MRTLILATASAITLGITGAGPLHATDANMPPASNAGPGNPNSAPATTR